MDEYEDEFVLMDYLNILWKRKWLIVIPTLFLVIAAGIISFLLPKKWEIDAIIVPSKFLVQTETGQYEEIVIVDAKQIAGQINEATYNNLIATELNLDIRKFPKLKAENLRDTNLVRVSTKEKDTEKAKLILFSLFNHLKRQLDEKMDIEIKGIDSVSRFLTSSFPPYWDPQGVSFAMEILTSLTTHIPCMELTFKPEKSALNLVKNIIE